MDKNILPLLAIFGTCCLLKVFFDLESARPEAIIIPLVSNSKIVSIQGGPAGDAEAHINVKRIKRRLHAQDCPPLWRSFLESYQTDTEETPEELPSLDGMVFSQTTSPKFTEISVFNEKHIYNLCDVFFVKIRSRDWKNQPKTYGGDFFRSKIYTEKPYSAASGDKIIDFKNGTYLALFTLRWTGKVKVQIKLVHPVELLPLMSTQLNGAFGLHTNFIGEFISGDIKERVMCHYTQLPAPMCNMSNPRTHGPWYCQHPKHTRLSCTDWKVNECNRKAFLALDAFIPQLSKDLIRKSNMRDIENNCSITVRDDVEKITATPSDLSSFPICRMKGPPTGIHSSGHFFKNKWYPDNCSVYDYDTLSGIDCLRNKTIIILGDSTARQIYHYFTETYKKYFETLPPLKGDLKTYGSLGIRSPKYNTSLHFHLHGLPIYSMSIVWKTTFIEFVADRISSGSDGCPAVYILSIWAHFVVPGREFYSQRMEAIRRAVTEFLDRCPRGKVIFKGANTREHSNKLGVAVVSSEWCIIKQEIALRQIFRDEKRVGFVNALDITGAQPYGDNVHPHDDIVKEFVNEALTYICED